MRTMNTPKKARAASKSATRPINFPADVVDLLEELLAASGTGLTVDDYARRYLSYNVVSTLNDHFVERADTRMGFGTSVADELEEDVALEDSPNLRRMAEVARRWLPRRAKMLKPLACGV